jgi:hypothetical protein
MRQIWLLLMRYRLRFVRWRLTRRLLSKRHAAEIKIGRPGGAHF